MSNFIVNPYVIAPSGGQTCPYTGEATVMALKNTRTALGVYIPSGSSVIGETLTHFTLYLLNANGASGTVTCGYMSNAEFAGTWDVSCTSFDSDTIGTGTTVKQMEFGSPVTISAGDCFGIYWNYTSSSDDDLNARCSPYGGSPTDGKLFAYSAWEVEAGRQPAWCYTTS